MIACFSGSCVYREEIGFAVPDEELRAIASQYAPANPTFWRFRFKARNGIDWEDRMSSAEVAGFLHAVDRFRSARGWSGK